MTIDIWGLNCLRNLVINKTFGFFHDILQGYRSSNPPNYIYNMSIRVRAQKQTFIALRVADLSSHPRYFEDGCFKLEWDTLPTFLQMRGAEIIFSPPTFEIWSLIRCGSDFLHDTCRAKYRSAYRGFSRYGKSNALSAIYFFNPCLCARPRVYTFRTVWVVLIEWDVRLRATLM